MPGLDFQGLHYYNPPCATAPALATPPARGKLCLVTMNSTWKRNGDQIEESLSLEKRASRSHNSYHLTGTNPIWKYIIIFPRVQIKKDRRSFCHLLQKRSSRKNMCVTVLILYQFRHMYQLAIVEIHFWSSYFPTLPGWGKIVLQTCLSSKHFTSEVPSKSLIEWHNLYWILRLCYGNHHLSVEI